jgi:signal transduction histidine kinase
MQRRAAIRAFLRSREAAGLIGKVVFAAALAVAAGYGFYQASLQAFVANKTDEKATALQLVDAFVSNYSNLRSELDADRAPVPATFRAHSIAQFNRARGAGNDLRVRWIGREGRSIATPPSDAHMAAVIESFVGKPNPEPVSRFVKVDGDQVFRTVYPSVARDQSCVDCHNRLQPEQSWQLDDVMGAFSIDAPAGPFLRGLRLECIGIGLIVFLVIGGAGSWASWDQHRRIAEREAARQKAETANRAKSSFLATMSHELRTPLNAIIGFSDMMRSEVHGAIGNERYHPYIDNIHESGEHLLQIITDILDLSKAESGKLDLDEDLFDLRDVVRSVRQLTGGRVAAGGLTEKIDLPADLPPLRADERKIKQVLLNLISNAVKFTPTGGTIELTARCDPRQGLTLIVADSGIGIPEADLDRVLKPFEQVDSSLSRQHQGTGLGLPLVRAMIELHGGTVTLKSTVGVGTQVILTLPAERLAYDLTPAPFATAA